MFASKMKLVLVFLCALFVLQQASRASAEAISLNFYGNVYPVAGQTPPTAGVVQVGNWNEIDPSVVHTNTALVNSSNASVGLTYSSAVYATSTGVANFGAGTGNTNMMTGIEYSTGIVDAVFTGTPYDMFDLYVYYNVSLYNQQEFSVLDSTGATTIASKLGYEQTEADAAFVESNGLAYDAGGNLANYVKFSLTSAELDTGFIIRADGVMGGAYGSMSGIQFVQTPEPSTLMLLATGVIGLLCYAWRKRR